MKEVINAPKNIKGYHLSLYVIIPLIFSSISLLSIVVVYRLVFFALKSNEDIELLLVFWSIFIVGGTYLTALIISWLILRPLETFVKKAEKSPVIQNMALDSKSHRVDQLTRFTSVLLQVSDILDQVDAREIFPEVIGQSQVMRSVLSQVLKVSPTDTSVLITGESGVGKEIIATSIHSHSKRKDEKLIAVNCAAIPPGLLESELFGHEKGAFTGATATKKGKFELANNGTIFLDEIGDMPLDTQAKILRALELGVCERVGGGEQIQFNVRVIAATNKNFAELIKNGQFREDLYHRLNVFPLHIPPLRERREDVPVLMDFFLSLFNCSYDVHPSVPQMLISYDWPGNVRELRNAIERAIVLATGEQIVIENFPDVQSSLGIVPVNFNDMNETPKLSSHVLSLDERLAEYEKAMIMNALQQTEGVQVRAAEKLGVKERSLWHRIKKYEINVDRFKL